MLQLYSWPTPNGHKIHIMLEECKLTYSVHPVNIGTGDQFKPDFLKISPNNKMPAIFAPMVRTVNPFRCSNQARFWFTWQPKRANSCPKATAINTVCPSG